MHTTYPPRETHAHHLSLVGASLLAMTMPASPRQPAMCLRRYSSGVVPIILRNMLMNAEALL